MKILRTIRIWLVGWLLLGGCTVPPWENLGLKPTPSPRPGNWCFEPIGITPGKTSKDEVLALLGEPDEVGMSNWWYARLSIGISFSAELVSSVYQYDVANCTLGDIIGTLGPPEVIEIVAQNNQPGPPVYPSKWFYYPSRGIVFLSPCLGALEWRACSSFHATDEITRRGFYMPTTVEEIIRTVRGDPRVTFLEWNGFTE